ncbi:MAG: hypothetical protein ACLQJ0_06085 [Steroidobacteraceae bacterium]
MSHKNRGAKLPPFTAIIRHTTKSDAWRALSVGARATFFVLQTFYNTKSQEPVFLSARDGAKELGCRKNNIGTWLDELEFYGFTEKVKEAHLAGVGKGSAAHYRLTDRWYAGKPPTYDYDKWNGVPFEPKRKAESEARIVRLKELNQSRKRRNPVPGSGTSRTRVGDVSSLPSAAPSSPPFKLPWSTPALTEMPYTAELRWLYAETETRAAA